MIAVLNNRVSRAKTVFRIGLIGAGCLLLYTSFNVFITANIGEYPLTVLLLVLSGLAGLLLLGAATLHKLIVPRWIILAAFLANALILAVIWTQTLGSTRVGRPMIALTQTDSAVYTEVAAGLLLRGHNPYDWDYSATMAGYRLNDATGTPTLLGNQEGPYPYPPLTILLTAPFLAVGLPGVFSLILLSYLALLVLTYILAPRYIAPVVLLPLAIGFANDLPVFGLIGVTDTIWVVLLIGVAVFRDRPVIAAVLYGLAASCKQSPWLIAPFLAIYLFAEQPDFRRGMIALLRFGLVSGGVFLLINLPFMIPNPRLWMLGVLEPLIDTLVFFGQNSPVNLTQYGYLYLPKPYFLIASMTMLAVTAFIYWRHFRSLRDVLWLLPGIYMWFSYRTLTTYWTFWVFPALVVLVRARFDPIHVTARPAKRWTVALAAGAFVFIVGIGAMMILPPPMHLRVQSPVIVGLNGRASLITVEIENTSKQTVTPRFAVHQTSYSTNPLIWQVVSGLPQIAPGARNVYKIAPRGESNSFYGHDRVQLLVTDSTDYALRATVEIGERSLLWPDSIPNPQFTMWNYIATSPVLWELVSRTPGRIEMLQKDDRDVLSFTMVKGELKKPVDERYVGLETQIVFPEKAFKIPYFTDSDFPADATIGIELDDGIHTKRFPFAPTDGKWLTAEIDIPQLYQAGGWEIPPLKRTVFRGLELPFRLVRVRLFLAADKDSINPIQVYFGAIEQPDYRIAPEHLMQETLNNPQAYYARIGDDLFTDGNYQRAAAAYQHALSYNPTDQDLIEKRDRALQLRAESDSP